MPSELARAYLGDDRELLSDGRGTHNLRTLLVSVQQPVGVASLCVAERQRRVASCEPRHIIDSDGAELGTGGSRCFRLSDCRLGSFRQNQPGTQSGDQMHHRHGCARWTADHSAPAADAIWKRPWPLTKLIRPQCRTGGVNGGLLPHRAWTGNHQETLKRQGHSTHLSFCHRSFAALAGWEDQVPRPTISRRVGDDGGGAHLQLDPPGSPELTQDTIRHHPSLPLCQMRL